MKIKSAFVLLFLFIPSIIFAGGLVFPDGTTITTAAGNSLSITLPNLPTGGLIGTAVATVDVNTHANIAQTTSGQDIIIPSPTIATPGKLFTIGNSGSVSFTVIGLTIPINKTATFIWNGAAWTIPAGSPTLVDLTLTDNLKIQSTVSAVVGPGVGNVVFKVEAGTKLNTLKLLLCTGTVPVCSLIADNLGS